MNFRHFFRFPPWLAAIALAMGVQGHALAAAQTPAAPASAQAQPAAKPAAEPENGGAPKVKDKNAKPAQEPDTIILSDTLHYNDAQKTSVFTGNVVMTRGLMTLRSDKLVVHQDADGNQYGTATVKPGKLVFIRQEKPEDFEVIEARGLRAEYNGKTDEVEMIGQAIVTRFICGKAFDKISGERVKYNQKTNVYEAYSGPDSATKGGRVRSIAQPRAKTDAAEAECRKKAGKG